MRDDCHSVRSVEDLGRLIRTTRKQQGLTLEDLSLVANTGSRVISEIERGKPTAQIAVVLRIVDTLGLRVLVEAPDVR